mmetsp:Transcript_16304/g.33487  ORF Transcript_16304/g.33487 Transcript_16304/m.33487 type:complete len:238 (-) Transcript_16304:317-1030(-)
MGNAQTCCPPTDSVCGACGKAGGDCCDDGKPESFKRQLRYNFVTADSQVEDERKRHKDIYNTGGKPLHIAAVLGNERQVLDIVESGVQVDIRDDLGRTALMMAGKYGRLTTAKLLVKLGAEVDAKDNRGQRLDTMIKKSNPVSEWLERYKETGNCSPISTYFGKQSVRFSRASTSPRPVSQNSHRSMLSSGSFRNSTSTAASQSTDAWSRNSTVLAVDVKMTPAQHRIAVANANSKN